MVEINGRIDSSTNATLEAHCNRLIQSGALWLILDLEEVNYINSRALCTLLALQKQLKPQGGNVVICGGKGPVGEIFEISGFTSMFPMAKTMEEAARFVL